MNAVTDYRFLSLVLGPCYLSALAPWGWQQFGPWYVPGLALWGVKPTWSLIKTLGWLLLGPVPSPWDDSGLVMFKVLRRTLAWFCLVSLKWPWLGFLSWLMFCVGPWDDSSPCLCAGTGLLDCSLGLWNEVGVSFLDLLWMTSWHLFRPIAESVSKLCCPWDPYVCKLENVGAGAVLVLFWLEFADWFSVVFLFKSKW